MYHRPLKSEERVQLLAALFSKVVPQPASEDIEDLIACLSMGQIQEYMYDIGFTITQTPLGVTIHQSTINNDSEWIAVKAQCLYEHLDSKATGK